MDFSVNATTTWNSLVDRTIFCSSTFSLGEKRVVAFDSSLSFLYNKVSEPVPWCGVRMPLIGGNLNASDQNMIKDWIDQGALDN